MSRRHPLLWLSITLEHIGLLVGAWSASILHRQDTASLIQPHGWIVLLGFFALVWFLGMYPFLRWPWMPYRRLFQCWFFVMTCALLCAVTLG